MTPNSSTTPSSSTEVRKARARAVFLGIMGIITVLSFVYAFVQQVKATKNAEEAVNQFERANLAEKRAEQNAIEATKQEDMAKEAMRLLEECRQSKGK